jgi:hypothetical protein
MALIGWRLWCIFFNWQEKPPQQRFVPIIRENKGADVNIATTHNIFFWVLFRSFGFFFFWNRFVFINAKVGKQNREQKKEEKKGQYCVQCLLSYRHQACHNQKVEGIGVQIVDGAVKVL